MKEKLIIQNFGPIKSVDLDLGKMTVLIGEQATGKSTIAKVLAVCRYFSYIFNTDFRNNNNNSFVEGLEIWGLKEFINTNSFINYKCNDYEIVAKYEGNDFENSNEKVVLNYDMFILKLKNESDNFKLLVEFTETHLSPLFGNEEDIENIDDLWKMPTGFYQNQVSKVMNNPFYLPTERGLQSIFSLGKNSIQNISDSLFNQFARLDQIARVFKNETSIEPLNISYKNVDGKGFIKKDNDNNFHSLYNAASGYQSTIPVVLLIKYYAEFKKKKKTFIIEEPEISLFPAAQKKLMTFFTKNINENGHKFIIETHSPYFLSAINDLLIAYKKGQKNQAEVEKIVKKESWLNPNDLSVYQLKDGKSFDIFDKKTGLISDNIIDEVSDEMNDVFDELLNIDDKRIIKI